MGDKGWMDVAVTYAPDVCLLAVILAGRLDDLWCHVGQRAHLRIRFNIQHAAEVTRVSNSMSPPAMEAPACRSWKRAHFCV